MACTADGTIYVTTATILDTGTQTLRRIHPQTFEVTTVGLLQGPQSTSAQGLAFSPAGELFGVSVADEFGSRARLLRVDPETAQVTQVGLVELPVHQSLDFTSDGRLFAVGRGPEASVLAELAPSNATVVGLPVTLTSHGDYRGIGFLPEPGAAVALIALIAWVARRGAGRRSRPR